MRRPDVILAHGDLDGMVSAILVVRAIGGPAEIKIANDATLARELERLSHRPVRPTSVHIVDVPLSAQCASQVVSAVQVLNQAGTRVTIIDHHTGWDAPEHVLALRSSCDRFAIDTTKTTAAAIVYRELCRDDPGARHWLQLLSERGESKDPIIRAEFGLLVALRSRENWPHTERALNTLALDGEWDYDMKRMSAFDFDALREQARSAAAQAEVVVTAGGCRVGWIDLRPYEQPLFVVPDVIAQHAVELVASVDRRGVVLGGPSIDQGIDLSPFHGEHEQCGIRFSVVGHRNPVRFSPADGDVSAAFLEAVRSFIVDRL